MLIFKKNKISVHNINLNECIGFNVYINKNQLWN